MRIGAHLGRERREPLEKPRLSSLPFGRHSPSMIRQSSIEVSP